MLEVILFWTWLCIALIVLMEGLLEIMDECHFPGDYEHWSKVFAVSVFWPLYFIKMLFDGVFKY